MKFVEVPIDTLSQDALRGVIEEFVTRDGTDYGVQERSLEDKIEALGKQLRKGEARIVFDPESDTCNIVLERDL